MLAEFYAAGGGTPASRLIETRVWPDPDVLLKGDGRRDATTDVQAMIDNAPAGAIVDGLGCTFTVSSLHIPSDRTVENFNLRTLPGTGNGRSPVTIGANYDTALRSNITLRNVHVDGQRQLQDAIEVAGDGELHGFRIVGPVDDLLIENCSAVNCATDGMLLYVGLGMMTLQSYDDGVKHRITIRDCEFNGNRRHGVAGDTMVGVTFDNVTCNGNGLDVEGDTDGALGSRSNGLLYGNGWDIEEYNLDTYFADLTWTGCVGVGNARAGLLIMSGPNVEADDPNFVVRSGFTIDGCHFDAGVSGTATQSLLVTPVAANRLRGVYFTDVTIRDSKLDGDVVLRCCGTVSITGGSIVPVSKTWLGTVDQCPGPVTVAADVDRAGKTFYVDGTPVVYR